MKPLRPALTLFLFMMMVQAEGQKQDTAYYASYPQLLTGRFFVSQKFTAFKFENRGEGYTLNYRPNTTINTGIGATYKWATLNLAYGWGFLNNDHEKGKTSYIDLQFHGFTQKFTLDFFGQFYSGFYLSPKGTAAPSDRYYQRPDMKVNLIGATYQYIFNYRKFSLRATYFQTDWQKKSAGSFLAGVEVYGGRVKADSTLTPYLINRNAAEKNDTGTTFVMFGPNVGYAYTLVINRHFFVTASATVSLDWGYNTLTAAEDGSEAGGLNTNILTRAIAGYNSSRWAFNIIYLNNGVGLTNNDSNRQLTLNTGNVRAIAAYRFELTKKEKELLKVIK